MNEALFFIHVGIVLAFALGALRLGKEALLAWTCIQALLANLFVLKQIEFFSLTVTCSDVFAVGGILGLNLLQEYFGQDSAKKAARSCLYFMLFFAAMAKMQLLYLPSPLDTTHSSYSTILSAAPRILLASLSVFFVVQQIDIRLFALIKTKFPELPLPFRNAASLFLSQLLDTILFSFVGLYGLVDNVFHIIVVSFIVKVAVILSSVPLTAFSKKFASQPKIETT